MSPCPTGYCGHPCTCPEAYDHTQPDDAKALINILQKRLTQLAEMEATKKHGEPMREVDHYELFVVGYELDGVIIKTRQSLGYVIAAPETKENIANLSSLWRVERDNDDLVFQRGAGPDDSVAVRSVILNYHNEVSASVMVERGRQNIEAIYTELVHSKKYLPTAI